MRHRVVLALLALLVAAPVAAQAPDGWMLRADRSTSAADPDAPGEIEFRTMGNGFHATNPAAAVYWHPENSASGEYTVRATFNLVRPSGHTNYYGLVFGGSQLEGSGQNYLYFLIAQNGTFIVKHRANDETVHDVINRTAHDAIRTPGDNGRSSNTLEVRVGANQTDYVVNGQVVGSTPKSGMTARTDGVYGIRVNHQLEVHIDDFGMSR